jgi:hypothetical protein
MRLQHKLIGSGAVLLALGGVGTATALAQASGAATSPAVHAPAAKATTAEPVEGTDTDNIQSGDQTTPDVPAAKATSLTKVSSSKASPSESESTTESETGPSDGPGGHEDPPGDVQNEQTGEN